MTTFDNSVTPTPDELPGRAPDPATTATPAPAPAPAAAEPEQPITPEYVAELRRRHEAAQQRAAQYERTYGGLPEDAQGALEDFAAMLREGDYDSAGEWALEASRNLTGDKWQALVARYGVTQAAAIVESAQPGAAPAAPADANTPLTAEQIRQMLAEDRQAAAEEAAEQARRAEVQTIAARIDNELHALSIVPGSPIAAAVRAQALQMFRETGQPVTMAAALQALRGTAGPVLAGVPIPATPTGGALAPNGSAGVAADTRTPVEKMNARLAAVRDQRRIS